MKEGSWCRVGLFRVVAVCAALAALAACGGPQLEVKPVEIGENPAAAVARLETDLAQAVQQQTNVLSPTWYGRAHQSLTTAQQILGRSGSLGEIANAVARGHAELEKAMELAKVSRATIPDAIKARDLARAAGAAEFGRDYERVETSFLEMTGNIEDGDARAAGRAQKDVVKAFHALEIRAIKERTLGAVRKLIAEAEELNARKSAPELLDEAKKALADTELFIASNPYAQEEIHTRADTARFKAARLMQLLRQVRRIEKMSALDVAILIESSLKKAADRLGATDMRDQPFGTQLDNIVGSIGSLVDDRQALSESVERQQNEIRRLQEKHIAEIDGQKMRYEEEISGMLAKIAALEGRSKQESERLARLEAEKRAEQERLEKQRLQAEAKLAAERRFNALYEKVSGTFSAEEAECYKQGMQLVIRLRSMRFPVGQAMILPENYALLSKVQQAIRSFGEPDVVIEGHTDSTGSPELNNVLSQQRADAVRAYMLANGVVKEPQIVAAGYGATRPLAPNTTAEGRAVNRRIDVVLKPRVVGAL